MGNNGDSDSYRIHYRDICPDCGSVGGSLGLVEIADADSLCAHHKCGECGAEWYCPTGRFPNQDTEI